ncbi:MAG: hypothetical protein HY360_21510 [Verrucomicrobia bacterium]|nr:hypothetical protein [Verrucomicrobiota bacterium]
MISVTENVDDDPEARGQHRLAMFFIWQLGSGRDKIRTQRKEPMNCFQKMLLIFLLATAGLSLKFAWSQDQEPSPAAPGDKWAQIQENHKQLIKTVDEIDENLAFVKIKVMQGPVKK